MRAPHGPGPTAPAAARRWTEDRPPARAQAPRVQPRAPLRTCSAGTGTDEAMPASFPLPPRSGRSDTWSGKCARQLRTLTSMSSFTCSCWSLSSPKASIIKPGVRQRQDLLFSNQRITTKSQPWLPSQRRELCSHCGESSGHGAVGARGAARAACSLWRGAGTPRNGLEAR